MTAMSLAFALLFVASFARAADAGDIVIVSTKGEVSITDGAGRTLRAGSVLEPPATVRTGRDGAIEFRQGATTVSVGPDTLLEFPALEKPGAPIDRIVQPRGNAFYNIGKRTGRKLRIETPYLVGVVKGTQFNVAARDEGTTISLFEGLLEVRAADDSDVVELRAGEVATRKVDDKSISVLQMKPVTPPPTSRPQTNNGTGAAPLSGSSRDSRQVDVADNVITAPGLSVSTSADVRNAGEVAAVGVSVRAPDVVLNTTPAIDTVDPGASVVVTVSAGNAMDVAASTAVDTTPGINSGVSAAVDAGPASVDAGTGVAIDAGPVSVDAGAGVAVDLMQPAAAASVDLGPAAGVDNAAADLGVEAEANANPGRASVSVEVTLPANAGNNGAAAAFDLGPSPNAAADVSINSGVDLGLGAASVDANVSVDLGLDEPATETVDTGNTTDNTPPGLDVDVDVGGALNGLLRRPGRK